MFYQYDICINYFNFCVFEQVYNRESYVGNRRISDQFFNVILL